MAPRISLALTLHNHQPVGNFGWVMAEVYDLAYEPMVAALERHSHVRLSLHYSGPLLEWLRAERPGFIARLSALVARGHDFPSGRDEVFLRAKRFEHFLVGHARAEISPTIRL